MKGGNVGTDIDESETKISAEVEKDADTIKAFYWGYDLKPFVDGYIVE